MMPSGARRSMVASGTSKGCISQYTCSSRTRRAISCVYCDPKSRMTITLPPGGPSAARALCALRCSDAPRTPAQGAARVRALRPLSSIATLFQPVVGCFFGDVHVVHVALAEAGGGDADEARLAPQVGQGAGPEVAHAGPQAAHELLHDEGQRAFVRHPALDSLRDELHAEFGALLVLEVAVAAALALAHGLEGAHAAVELVGAPLVQDRLT